MSMKTFSVIAIVVVAVFASAPSVARAQDAAKQGPDVVRDSDLEKDSLHNLEVAWEYFKLKKAYVAALQRCEEIIAGNPTFSKIDKVLYIAGESNLYLSEGKGKQKASLYLRREGGKPYTLTSNQFRNEARDYLSQLVNEYPGSQFKDGALEDLKSLGGPKPKES